MRLTLLFLHGWAFDGAFWGALRAELGGFPAAIADRGYFGPPASPAPEGPVLAVGHSLGALLALRAPPKGCIGLVAINGFDHFAAREDAPGVPRRLVDRMVAKFATAPEEVVRDFRHRCAAPPAPASLVPKTLESDLHLLRDADERRRSAAWTLPLLALHGEQDPILPAALRAEAFASAARLERAAHPSAGHVLPLSHASWCAARIRELVERLQ